MGAGSGALGAGGAAAPAAPLTRAEIASAPTPELTRRLQAEVAALARRVAQDRALQFQHSVRQLGDLVAEALARWRNSTALALHTIASLEEELARKADALRDSHARGADKGAALASSEAEKEALRLYASRLELHLGHMVEAAVASGAQGARGAAALGAAAQGVAAPAEPAAGLPPASAAVSPQLPPQILAALRGLLAATSMPGGSATAPSATVDEVEGLRSAVREGSDTVSRFFASLDAAAHLQNAPSNDAAVLASSSSTTAPPGAADSSGDLAKQHEQALRNVDATLRRALAFAGVEAQPPIPASAPRATPLPAVASALARLPVAARASAHALPLATPAPSTASAAAMSPSLPSLAPAAAAGPSSRGAVLEIEFDPQLHARATVGQLKAAVAAKAGKTPLSIAIGGRVLHDDASRLVDVGVPVRASIEVLFGKGHEGSPAAVLAQPAPAASSHEPVSARAPLPPQPPAPASASAPASVPAPAPAPAPVAPHVPRPSAPLPVHAKLSPPMQKQPLTSPAPHRAPRGLSAISKEDADADVQSPLPSSPRAAAPTEDDKARVLSLATSADGRATGSVFHHALAHPSQAAQREAICRSIFATIDTDGSGTLSFEELSSYVLSVRALVDGKQSSGSPSSLAGESADSVPLEYHAAFCAVLMEASSSLEDAFKLYDVDGNGTLSIDEFQLLGDAVFLGSATDGQRAARERELKQAALESARRAQREAAELAAQQAQLAQQAAAARALKESEARAAAAATAAAAAAAAAAASPAHAHAEEALTALRSAKRAVTGASPPGRKAKPPSTPSVVADSSVSYEDTPRAS